MSDKGTTDCITPEPSALEVAQAALIKAAMDQSMSPNGAAFSAYINGLLQSARLTSVIKFLLFQNPAFEQMLTEYTVAELNETIIPKLVSQKASPILSAGHH